MQTHQGLSRRDFLAVTGAGTVAAALAGPGVALSAEPPRPRRVVLIAGTPSHGPGDHEFNAGVRLLAKCLSRVPGLQVIPQLNGYPPDESIFDGADAIVLYADGGPRHPFTQGNRLQTIGALMDRGVGLMCMHYAVEVLKDNGGPEFRDWIGGHYEHEFSCNPMWTPEFTEFPKHPITSGVEPFAVKDEWYFNMRFRPELQGITPILVAKPSDATRDGPYVYPRGPYPHIQANKGQPETMMWAIDRKDGGRGVGFTGGHIHRNWLDNNYRKVVLNAILWVSKLDVPANGIASTVTMTEIGENLDPKPARK